jgi:hypothetical protein
MNREALEKQIQEVRKEIEGLQQNMKKLDMDYSLRYNYQLKLKRIHRDPLSDEQNRQLTKIDVLNYVMAALLRLLKIYYRIINFT